MVARSHSCKKCKSKFFGTIDEKHWFCSVRCKLSYSPSKKELEEEKKREARDIELRRQEEKKFPIRKVRRTHSPSLYGSLLKKYNALKTKKTMFVEVKKAIKVREPHPFYDSERWLSLRYKAFKLYGRSCVLCKISNTEMHVDHIKPRSKYPELSLEINNLQILCRACNLGKSNRDQTDFRSHIRE